MEIKAVERYADVMFAFPPKIRYFVEVEAAGGAVFCAYKNSEPIGIVCLKTLGSVYDTAYLYTKENHRRHGIAKSLMEHAAVYAESNGTPLRLRILENREYTAACIKIAEALHMRPGVGMTFFVMEVNDNAKRAWAEYRPGALKLLAKIEKKTGQQQVVSFAEAGEAVLHRLREKIGNELPLLDPFALPELDMDFSFLLLQKSEPVAFNAVRTIGRKMVYEISAAQPGSGGTMLAIAPRFFDKLFDSPIERVTCMVYNSNTAGLNHVTKRFGFLFKESGKQTVYVR